MEFVTMALVPSGKTRVMVAQNYGNSLSEGYSEDPISSGGGGPISFDTEGALNDEVGEAPTSDIEPQVEPQQEMGAKKKTLTNYVFKKLQEWGYPGRRLQEFRSKFVKETVSAEGIKDVQIEIPDRKYSETGPAGGIENEDLKSIAAEVNKMFGLNFNGADRSDGKWTIKFTSQKITNPEDEMPRDNLDAVYGTPSGADSQEGRPIAAHTLREMIKAAKDSIVKRLKKSNGD
jgi:hypothetical protein